MLVMDETATNATAGVNIVFNAFAGTYTLTATYKGTGAVSAVRQSCTYTTYIPAKHMLATGIQMVYMSALSAWFAVGRIGYA